MTSGAKSLSMESNASSPEVSEVLPPPICVLGGAPSVEVVSGIGEGGYSTVVLVRPVQRKSSSNTPGDVFAMKVVSKNNKKDQRSLASELAVLRDIPRSRFLEHCHAAFESATDVFFVCDFIAGGDLFYHVSCRTLEGKWGFEEDECRVLLAEVTLGLEHLHYHGFIHRDIKVENIVLDASGHVKLIDFGLACSLTQSEHPMNLSGSLIYMAPELIKDKTGGRHTDWWAIGIVAFELISGRTPWSSLTDRTVIKVPMKIRSKFLIPYVWEYILGT